jgi:excisionase family DNA binding protein
MFSVYTLAAYWFVSPDTVRSMIKRGEWTSVRIGGQVRIRAECVDEYQAR